MHSESSPRARWPSTFGETQFPRGLCLGPETAGGITWVTTGGAGGDLDTDFFLWEVGDWPEIETTIHEHHFLSVSIASDAMTVSALDAGGVELHSFTVPP